MGNDGGALTAVIAGGKAVGKSAGMAVGGGKNPTNQDGMLHGGLLLGTNFILKVEASSQWGVASRL